MNIAYNVLNTIGKTPLVYLNRIPQSEGCRARVVAKLEGLNPSSSVKDRVAMSMLEAAEKSGLIEPGKTVLVEPTLGNTGVALALVAAIKGYQLILTMPDTMSYEHQLLIRSYGARIELTEGSKGMKGAIAKASAIANSLPDSFVLQQFSNKANVSVHRHTTAEEIWNDTDGQVDIVVAGVGTGGTITGIAEALKPRKPKFQIIAVEPAESPVLSGGKPGPHQIQGLGAGFIPDILKIDLIDEVVQVRSEAAITYTCRLAREEGILSGISSGAALYAAIQIAKRSENADKLVVFIQPSFGERYLSTGIFSNSLGACSHYRAKSAAVNIK